MADEKKPVLGSTLLAKIGECLGLMTNHDQIQKEQRKIEEQFIAYFCELVWNTDVLKFFDSLVEHKDVFTTKDGCALPGVRYFMDEYKRPGVQIEVHPAKDVKFGENVVFFLLEYVKHNLAPDSSAKMHLPQICFYDVQANLPKQPSFIPLDQVYRRLFKEQAVDKIKDLIETRLSEVTNAYLSILNNAK